MRRIIFFWALLGCHTLWAQAPIFEPTMTITEFGIVNSPLGEEVDKIIDGTTATKFLDFELLDGMGFTVELGFSAIATQIEIWTANDFPERDPMNFEVLGSNDGSTFVSVATGTLDCIADRFFSRILNLDNTIDFQYYQINFTDACDPSGGAGIPSIQLSEVQLYGEILAVADTALEEALKLFPNPTQDEFVLNYTGLEPLTAANLFDVQGRKIMELELENIINGQSINVSQLPTGLYFVRLQTAQALAVKRLIVR